MPKRNKRRGKSKLLRKETGLTLTVVGGVLVGLIAVYLVWSNIW